MFPGCPCKCHKEEAKEDTKKEHEEIMLSTGYIKTPSGWIAEGTATPAQMIYHLDWIKSREEPARKLPSERIRELGGIKHHFMLDGFEGNTELKVINHAIDELSRRVKGVIEYLDETQ